jgi:hypothetical protein
MHGVWIPFCFACEMYVWIGVKFVLCGCVGVEKNICTGDREWYGDIIVFDGEWVMSVERVVMNRSSMKSQLVRVQKGMKDLH